MTLQEAYPRFRALIDKRDQADKLSLELLRHPQVREVSAQLLDVCDMKLRIHEAIRDAVTKLRAKYPNSKLGAVMPWNRPEYDQYQRMEK